MLLVLPSIRDGNMWGYSPLLSAEVPSTTCVPGKVESVDRLQIEKIGGAAGFGGPYSRLKSRGEVAFSDLSPADRQTVEDLFKNPEKAVPPPRGAADFFSYCITRQTAAGPETIKVPENAVPAALKDSVRDVIE
jgi:hypothetical protein